MTHFMIYRDESVSSGLMDLLLVHITNQFTSNLDKKMLCSLLINSNVMLLKVFV